MKKILLVLFLLSQPLFAGTEFTARLESTSSPTAWVNIDGWVAKDSLRLDFIGPWTRGSMIYDKRTDDIIIIDDLNKMVLTFGSTTQATFKMVEGLAGHSLKSQLNDAPKSAQMAYRLAEANVRALFEGQLVLKKHNAPMDGRSCDLYQYAPSGQKVREVWIVPQGQSGLTADDLDTLQNWAYHLVDLLSPSIQQMGGDPMAFLSRKVDSDVPTHLALYADGKISTRFKVISVHPAEFGPEKFQAPAGYQKAGLLDLVRGN